MKDLPPYIDILSHLPWKYLESRKMLEKARSCEKRAELIKLVGSFAGTEPEDLTLDLVRDLDRSARHSIQMGDVAAAERFWVCARLVEYCLSLYQRPFCKSCYLSVTLRSDGRLKKFCAGHSSGKEAGHTAEYQRGRKRQQKMDRLLSLLPSAEEFAQALLTYQLNSLRAKGGAPATIISRFDFNRFILFKSIVQMDAASISKNADDSLVRSEADTKWHDSADERLVRLKQLDDAAGGPGRWRIDPSKLGLPDITQNYPDWTELASRWRALFADSDGLQRLKGVGDGAVTPLMLLEQWLRWKAWTVAGDPVAQIGKGRPAQFDQDEALRLRAEGMRVSEIAEKFPRIKPKSLIVFFSRWDLAHIDREQAVRMHREGKTDEEIAKIFGVAVRSVTKVLALDMDGSD